MIMQYNFALYFCVHLYAGCDDQTKPCFCTSIWMPCLQSSVDRKVKTIISATVMSNDIRSKNHEFI